MKIEGQNGFSIVELMIGIVAAAILALTAGTMLANVYKGWARGLALADMERDAAVAIHTLDLAVRGASNAVWNGAARTLTNYMPSSVTRVFVASGGSLSCNGQTLVDQRLEFFSAPVTGRDVWVSIVLTNQNIRMGVTNMCIRMRNMP